MNYIERFHNFTHLVWQILLTLFLGFAAFILPAYIPLPSYEWSVGDTTCSQNNDLYFCIPSLLTYTPPTMVETLVHLLFLGLALTVTVILAISVVRIFRQCLKHLAT